MKQVKLMLIVILSIMLIDITTVNATNNNLLYYTNENGVTFSLEEYEFLSKMYWNGYQDIMTQADYEEFKDSNIINGTFE